MSHHLYPVRVAFYGMAGIVKVGGVLRVISRPPVIPGLPLLDGIDYAPEVCRDIQPQHHARREMTADELGCVKAWLRAVEAGSA